MVPMNPFLRRGQLKVLWKNTGDAGSRSGLACPCLAMLEGDLSEMVQGEISSLEQRSESSTALFRLGHL